VVWLIFGIWNAVNDPLFGYISDRTKSGLGRRIPYIRYGAPLIALAFIACWIAWPTPALTPYANGAWWTSPAQLSMFLQFIVALFIYDTLWTAIATSIYIMPYEMAVSNKARSGVFVWKVPFQLIANLAPLAIPFIKPQPGDDPTMFRALVIGLGVFLGVVVYASTYFYEEKHFQQDEPQPPFFKSLIECFKNKSFVVFEVLSFTVIYVQVALNQGLIYYFDEMKVSPLPIYGALFAGIFVGVALWVTTNPRWGVKRTMQVMCVLFALGCLSLLLGRDVLPAMFGFLLIGFGFAGGMYLVPIMNGDVIDADEHRTGLRREGMYAGINSLITKPAASIATAVFLTTIDWFGYDKTLKAGLQSYEAQTGILLGWGLVPAVLLFLSFLSLFLYPLAGPAWEEIKTRLAQLHAEKEARHLAQLGYAAPHS
jgi:GPH family glycoside/pentoside/hexuronide:cation symporter